MKTPKTAIIHRMLVPALIAVLNLLPAGRVTAQTFTTLHSFTGGSDGANPYAGLITDSSGNTLYGTTGCPSCPGYGTVFTVHADGTGFKNLHSFTATSGAYPFTNSDGATPVAGLVLSGDTLYGTAYFGGSSGVGTVFAVNTDGTGFTNLHSFTGGDGTFPDGALILTNNTLYGVTHGYGRGTFGSVFAIHTDGTGFTNLHSFRAGGYISPERYYTNSDGVYPNGALILSGNTLYGAASYAGISGAGTVFAVNTDGTGFAILHSFSYDSEGSGPSGGLILSGSTLYGTAAGGGNSGYGAVFALNTDGTGFTNLYSVRAGGYNSSGHYTNSDGAYLEAGLIVSGSTLYGTAGTGGSLGWGTVFAVNTDGTGFTNLHTFIGSDGGFPAAGLILSGNTLYGTAVEGGSENNGTVFSLSLALPSATQINGLIALTQGLGLPSGTANSLVVELQAAASALDRGNNQAACGNLGAFLNEVNAQTGQKLTAAQADLLIAEATRIRAVLGCR